LNKRAAALAAINLNQIFKKGKHKYESQNERQSRGHQWGYLCWRRLLLASLVSSLNQGNLTFSRKGNTSMKIKTNVKAGRRGDPDDGGQ